jgi:RNA polymerase sigma factor (sigma-70 family)
VGSDNPVEIDAGSFCRSLYPRLVGALSLNCGNREDAQELAQETLSRVLEHWDRLREHDDPEAWAFRTAFNLANSWWRRRVVARRVEELLRRRRGDESVPVDATDDEIDLRRAVATLPRRQREAVVLRYFVDCSVSETAARMGCAEGTVKALTHQAIDTLRQTALADLEGDDDE